MSDLDPDALAAVLLDETAGLALELHAAIEALCREGVALQLAAPVAAIFEQPAGAKPRHRAAGRRASSSPWRPTSAERVRELAGYAAGEDNPALEPLALACFYVIDARRTNAFGLHERPRPRPLARVLDEEEARRDPTLPVGTALIRVWSELSGEPGVCVELGYAAEASSSRRRGILDVAALLERVARAQLLVAGDAVPPQRAVARQLVGSRPAERRRVDVNRQRDLPRGVTHAVDVRAVEAERLAGGELDAREPVAPGRSTMCSSATVPRTTCTAPTDPS